MWVNITKFRGVRSPAEGGPKLKLAEKDAIPNARCTQCHTTTLQAFSDEPAHSVVLDKIRAGTASCISSGCHGPAHPTANGDKPPAAEALR